MSRLVTPAIWTDSTTEDIEDAITKLRVLLDDRLRERINRKETMSDLERFPFYDSELEV